MSLFFKRISANGSGHAVAWVGLALSALLAPACKAPSAPAPASRAPASQAPATQAPSTQAPASQAPSAASRTEPAQATASGVGSTTAPAAAAVPASAAGTPSAAPEPLADAAVPTTDAGAADAGADAAVEHPWPTAAAAVIARPKETVLLSRDGQSRVIGPAAEWCLADPRRGLVWLRTADDTLMGVDLWAGGAPQPLTGPVPSGAPIWFFDGETHNPAIDEASDDVGLEVALTATPALSPRTICRGDRSFYCYTDGDEAKGLEPELAHRLTRLEALRLYPGGAGWLSARAARPVRPPTPPLAAAPRVKVDATACTESPKDCGTGTKVPGTSWARIEVGNSRGDFYHRDLALIDLASGKMRHPEDPTRVRAATEPVDDFLIGRFDLAPDGGAWLTTDQLVDATGKRSFPHGGQVCGWWQPAPLERR